MILYFSNKKQKYEVSKANTEEGDPGWTIEISVDKIILIQFSHYRAMRINNDDFSNELLLYIFKIS
jgi:hypothetical protein